MRKIALLVLLLSLLPFEVGWGYGIVNNSGTSAADSLSIPFFLLDSAGNQVAIANGDSVFLVVWDASGAMVFQDSGAYNDADITTHTRHGMTWYSWQAAVADIDGSSGEGVFSYTFSVHDKTSANLWTPHSGHFQLYAGGDFDVMLDSIGLAARDARASHDTLDNWDDEIAEINNLIDSLYAVLDSLQAGFASRSPIGDTTQGVDEVYAEVQNLDGWNPVTDNDSLVIDRGALLPELADAVWDEILADHTIAGSVGDVLLDSIDAKVSSAGGTANVPDSVAAIVDKIRRLAAEFGVGDPIQVRYIDTAGDNSNGLTWATAWTGFDSVKTLTKATRVLVGPGVYTDVACSLHTSGLEILSTNGPGQTTIHGQDSATYSGDSLSHPFSVGRSSSLEKNIRIVGFTIISHKLDNPGDPQFRCAIRLQDSLEYVEIANCIFPFDNYKTVGSSSDGDEHVRYLDIHHNIFAQNHTHAIDLAPELSIIHHNYFLDPDSTDRSNMKPIQLYTGGRHNAVHSNYIVGSNWSIVLNGADSNLVADNYVWVGQGLVSYSASPSVDNTWAANWAQNWAPEYRDADGDVSNTISDEMRSLWKNLAVRQMPESHLPNGHFDVYTGADTTACPPGWRGVTGAAVITTEQTASDSWGALRCGGASAYLSSEYMYLDTGWYEFAGDLYIATDSAQARLSVSRAAPSPNTLAWVNWNWDTTYTHASYTTYTDTALHNKWTGVMHRFHVTTPGSHYIELGGWDEGNDDTLRLYWDNVALRRSDLSSHDVAVIADRTECGYEVALMPDHWTAADSSGFQGSASGLTAAEVAAAVWDEDTTGHYSSGTYGFEAAQSGVGSGSGAYSYAVQLYDSAASQAIPGARVAVRDLSQSALIAVGTSGSGGLASFNLDADSFLVIVSATGYVFGAFDTIVVGGDYVDTVYGSQFDPGAPSSPDLCRVYGHLYDLNGDPETAAVTAHLPSGVVRYNDLIVSPFSVSGSTDSTGYFYLDLIPSDSLTPAGVLYEFSITRQDGTILRQRLSVPDSTSWRLVW